MRGVGHIRWITGTVRLVFSDIGSIPFMNSFPQTGEKRVIFDAATESKNVVAKVVPPESEQEPNESRR